MQGDGRSAVLQSRGRSALRACPGRLWCSLRCSSQPFTPARRRTCPPCWHCRWRWATTTSARDASCRRSSRTWPSTPSSYACNWPRRPTDRHKCSVRSMSLGAVVWPLGQPRDTLAKTWPDGCLFTPPMLRITRRPDRLTRREATS